MLVLWRLGQEPLLQQQVILQELLTQQGLYAHLWQLQQEEREHKLALETVTDAV